MAEALEHLRVIELCDDVQGAYCGKQFAAWGADVVVVEPRGGHRLRGARPLARARDGAQVSLLWEYLAGRKRSLELEDGGAAGSRLRDLLAGADVLITDWKPARLKAAGLDFDAASRSNPGLVYLHLSPFGLSGPYAGFEGTDLIAQALSAFCSFNGYPDREPVKIAANVLAYACGMTGFIGALAALRDRRLSGAGQMVEVSYMEAISAIVPSLRVEYYGQAAKRSGTTGTGNDTFKVKDGYVYFSVVADRPWEDFLTAMNIAPDAAPEELRTREGRMDRARLRAWLEERLEGRSALDLFLTLNTFRITTGIIFDPEDLAEDPHLVDRGFLHQVDHPKLGPITVPGAPGKMSLTPMAPPQPSPELGAGKMDSAIWDRGEAVESQGALSSQNPDSRFQSPPATAPLRGLRILDLTAAWVGTYASMLLGDLGADIIKIESPTRPDVWRGVDAPLRLPPIARPGSHPWNLNVNFNSVNRNKRSTCLDLDTERGKELFLRLAEKSDLVMENYTPRVMDNFGLGYEALRRVKDDIVMVSFSGFGASGPYADFRAIGATIEMEVGWDSLQGYPDREPIMLGAMYADAITGLHMAGMALTALEYRDQTGLGQRAEGSMFEAGVAYIGEEIMRAALPVPPLRPTGGSGDEVPRTQRRANRHLDLAPHGVYPCAGDDRWIAIVARDDDEWRHLLDVAGPSSALDRPEFQTMAGRLAHVDELDRAVAAWTADKDARELMLALQKAGVPAGVVLDSAEVLEDEHLKARDWFIPMTHPDLGTQRYGGFAWRFSRSTCVAKTPSPRLGEYSREVLATELGLSDAEIEALFAEGITGQTLEKAEVPAAS